MNSISNLCGATKTAGLISGREVDGCGCCSVCKDFAALTALASNSNFEYRGGDFCFGLFKSAAASFPAVKAACKNLLAVDVLGCGSTDSAFFGETVAADVDGWGSTGEEEELLLAASEAAMHCFATLEGDGCTFLCLKLDCSADLKLFAAFHFLVGIGSAKATFPERKVLPPSVEKSWRCFTGESFGDVSADDSVSSFGNGLCDGDDGSEIDDLAFLGVAGQDPEV